MKLNRLIKIALTGSLLIAANTSAQIYNLVSYNKNLLDVSSTQDDNWSLYSPFYMLDANPATRWGSKFQDNQSFIVDLGYAQPIDKIVIKWEAAFAKNVTIQTSQTNQNDYVTVYNTQSNNGGNQTLTQSFGRARYIKFLMSNRSNPAYGFSIWDLELYSLENHSVHKAIQLQRYSDYARNPRPECTAANVGLMVVEQNGKYQQNSILSVCMGYIDFQNSYFRWVQLAQGKM